MGWPLSVASYLLSVYMNSVFTDKLVIAFLGRFVRACTWKWCFLEYIQNFQLPSPRPLPLEHWKVATRGEHFQCLSPWIATTLIPLFLSQILFIAGIVFIIGLERTYQFFFQAHKLKGTVFFMGGILIVLIGWPIVGSLVELYGAFCLFR